MTCLKFILAASLLQSLAAEEFIPRRQSSIPGPALSPEEARKKMTVPEGFVVELVAAEPDVVNPIAMTVDERGRIWITESVEYPRQSAGVGRDRIKVLEDTTGDGNADKVTIFAEGLNIPCGVAIGHGGVWVANSPDILFMKDTDGDGKADHTEVVVTGFGRDDTHELPNSLTWGPDGWLYGLNGVFNRSIVKHQGKTHDFTCAVFRIHPKTREFELFAEGTSNPWGIVYDTEGSMFLSACVIDHLWHITESGYYHRQGGAYPAFTWKAESIVDYRHQMAAYCGLVYFDSDAFPEKYRDTLYMGNIHASAINSDRLERRGSTYVGKKGEDLLTANDVWFMPVSQKVGPDGNLYILDWYDRYHCYQDAVRDPEGVNRTHGRLWRLRHTGTEVQRGPFPDLGKETDDQLIQRLHSGNVYHRDTAQRLLSERNTAATLVKLQQLVLDPATPHKPRMHALFTLVSAGVLDEKFHLALLASKEPSLRAWGIRAAGNARSATPALAAKLAGLSADESPDVRLQLAIAATKIPALDEISLLADTFVRAGDDVLLPRIAWKNLHPLLEKQAPAFLARVSAADLAAAPALRGILPRVTERILAVKELDADAVATLLELLIDRKLNTEASACLASLATRVRSGELGSDRLAQVTAKIQPILDPLLQGPESHPLFFDAAATAATWKQPQAMAAMHRALVSTEANEKRRLTALDALVAAGDTTLVAPVTAILNASASPGFQTSILQSLGRLDDPAIPGMIVAAWPKLTAAVHPVALQLLTQRKAGTLALLDAIKSGQIQPETLNHNQVRQLASGGDAEITARVEAIWGAIRMDRNPAREQVIAKVHERAKVTPGDPVAGRVVFERACAACHMIHGKGYAIGPDLTVNGRGSFEQLLSNVLDPSLVVGPAYQLRTVTTTDGRTIAGMISEDNPQRLVLKMLGGQIETIARDRVANIATASISFMPEGLEHTMSEQELLDLLSFLSHDLPPENPEARLIEGAPSPIRSTPGGQKTK